MSSYAISATVKAAPPEVLAFIRHHLAFGTDHLLLFFDDPHDPMLDVVGEFENVTAVICDDRYWEPVGSRPERLNKRQGYNVAAAHEWALGQSHDWLLHMDSDEFLFADSDFLGLLDRVGAADGLVLLPLEVVQVEARTSLIGPRIFKVPKMKGLGEILPDADGNPVEVLDHRAAVKRFEALFGEERARVIMINGHKHGKSAVRVAAGRYKKFNAHRPLPVSGVELDLRVAPDGFELHYDGHDYEEWKQKWMARLDLKPVGTPRRRRQWAEFIELGEAGDEAAMRDYFALRRLPTEDEIEVALDLGLLRRIDTPVLADPNGEARDEPLLPGQ